ncbi:MAG: formylglycine-generating enzyme family protein [Thermoanaerobaculales bacterium]|nr:formylglycine-generating enzyme family protein [Thermoanaerobaculales bacterium]
MWKTDLCVRNIGVDHATIRMFFLPKGSDNTSVAEFEKYLEASEQVLFEDFIDGIFHTVGSGAVLIHSNGPLLVTSRTFSLAPEGTYGQFIGGFSLSDAIAHGEDGRMIQLSRSVSEETGFRTNIGFASVAATSISVSVELFSGSGARLGVRHYSLKPFEYMQRNDIFGEVTEGAVTNGAAVVSTSTPGGRFFSYASVVDNDSGDPYFMPATVSDRVSSPPPPPFGEEITLALPGGVEMDLVHIPKGTFWMGSPPDERGRGTDEDLHKVTLTRGYYLGKYEVTHAQWQAVMGAPITSDCGNLALDPNDPVYCVSWNEVCGGVTGEDCTAESFLGRLNQHLGTNAFRLPTDAEWERAARAGTQTPFSFGDNLSCSVSDCSFCALFDQHMVWCGNDNGHAEEAITRLPNSFGLYDMHGNLYEWTADWYTPSLGTHEQIDPTGPPSGPDRVRRGGYYNLKARYCRSANRAGRYPASRSPTIGFRPARFE